MALALVNVPVSIAAPQPGIFPRQTANISPALRNAYLEFVNTVLDYAREFPSCAPGLPTAESLNVYLRTPECSDAAAYVTNNTCGFSESAIARNDMDALACECEYSGEQPLEPLGRCFDALCGEEDAEKAKELTKEIVEVGSEKCWDAVKVGREQAAGGDNGTRPGLNETDVPNMDPSSGMKLGVGKGMLVFAVMVLPVFGLVL